MASMERMPSLHRRPTVARVFVLAISGYCGNDAFSIDFADTIIRGVSDDK